MALFRVFHPDATADADATPSRLMRRLSTLATKSGALASYHGHRTADIPDVLRELLECGALASLHSPSPGQFASASQLQAAAVAAAKTKELVVYDEDSLYSHFSAARDAFPPHFVQFYIKYH